MNNSLRDVGIAHAEIGDFDGARAAAAAVRNSDTRKFEHAKGAVIWAIAAAEAKRGDREKAWETIDAVDDPQMRITGLRSLAESQAKAKDIEGALATIARIKLETAHGQTQQSEALHALAKTQIDARDFSAAAATAAKMADRWQEKKTLLEIAQAQAAKGDVAAVESTIAQLGDYSKDHAQLALITARATGGDVGGAVAAASGLSYDSKAAALRLIARAQIQAGDFAGAKGTLKETHGEETGTLLCDLALAQLPTDPDAARSSIADAKFMVGRHGHRLEYRIVEAYARAGDFAIATMLAHAIKDYDWKQGAFAKIALERAAANGFEDAVQWSEKLSAPTASVNCLIALAQERLKPKHGGPAAGPPQASGA
jgi:hypothetical protein